jgi:hypothetical protein
MTTTPTVRQRGSRTRSGAVLLVAIAALVVVTAIAGVAASTALRLRQSCKTERDLIQVEFLCDAGILRARQQLAKDRNYDGEEWTLGPAPSGESQWSVTISLVPGTASSAPGANALTEPHTERVIQVRARIEGRTHAPKSIQRTYTVSIPSNQP